LSEKVKDEVDGACGHSMGRETKAYGIWVRTGERKKPFGKTRFGRVYNIKMVINKYVRKTFTLFK
jgi:hypothetical protein